MKMYRMAIPNDRTAGGVDEHLSFGREKNVKGQKYQILKVLQTAQNIVLKSENAAIVQILLKMVFLNVIFKSKGVILYDMVV